MESSPRRVVVTGLNMMTALGLDLKSCWDNLVAGKSGVHRISLFDPKDCETQIAAELPAGFDEYAAERCSKRLSRQMGRAIKMGYVCAREAVAGSGIDFGAYDRLRCATVFGAADTGHSAIYDDKYWIMKTMPHGLSAWVSMEYGLEGPNFTVSAACASSAYAIANGYELIRRNQADVVITGGASSIVNPEHVKGFNELFALSTSNALLERASRPFSLGRDGFVMGEGAGVLILEAEDAARKRGASIHAEVLGYAMTSETYNIMAPMSDGAGMAKTMKRALENSKVATTQVDYINAHGTSTPLNDRYETRAIKDVFGVRAHEIPVSSSKSMVGHTAGACGAVEAAITILSLCRDTLTPTINYERDPELDLDYVPGVARRKDVRIAMSNSFGFGGCNASLLFGKYSP